MDFIQGYNIRKSLRSPVSIVLRDHEDSEGNILIILIHSN